MPATFQVVQMGGIWYWVRWGRCFKWAWQRGR